jgi:hypothetical protein
MELPTEIWLYISKFIPDDTLRQMLEVNRVFYSLSMDIRYREVELKKADPASDRMLARLM